MASQSYPQDKQYGGQPPAYPNQAYHPSNPPYNTGQYQAQPQPQVVYVERREKEDKDSRWCPAACCLGLCTVCCLPCCICC